uniref:Prolyl 4-hydroxylase alpha subunit Fe(2+) 2OG dioxygenase domain-containing protein n=1 Tax=Chromera velia CCMP2878 TaxID=1169474 RepID=A0A0G4HIV3_9ALVE|eukprot:Cvel_28032.t1-p1 / transcript=Cvel_28032.t1 / gene=Cvel_28032 / organism=Chromera_velia_CCMP2878 / gene_product=hypothetical protein / transcript_product=hypothetical protein / location=Cvel_scaffold3600:4453-4923(-) / protein_length=157 / sequence_SO=supercontig / SO=protein_coding / is_pseudo=false
MLPEVLNKEEETTLVDIAARTLAPFLGREGSDLVLCQNNANDSPWVNFYTRAGRLEIHPDFKKSEFFSEPEKVFTVLFALRTSGECLDFWRGSSPEEMKKRKPDLRISLKSGTFVAFRGNVYHCPQAAKREGRMTCTFAFVCAEQADRYAKYGVEAK